MTCAVAGCSGGAIADDGPQTATAEPAESGSASVTVPAGGAVTTLSLAIAEATTTSTDAAAAKSASSTEPRAKPSSSLTAGNGSAAVFPLTVIDETGTEIVVTSIERIIPLDGDVAEVVFALGLGGNVVATDLSATYPPQADALPEIGYQRALAAETIAAHSPTLLLATKIAGPPETLDDLRRLGYPLVIVPNEPTPQGAGRKIRAVASALGIPKRGAELAAEIDAAIAAATVGDQDVVARPRVLALYVRGTVAQLVLGESSNTHWLIDAAGGIDLSVSMGVRDSAPISAEAILAAAPDVLIIPEAGLASVGGIDSLLEIGGLGRTPAGLRRQVLAYDGQLLLGNGPRTAEMLARLRDDLSSVEAAATSGESQ